MAGSPFSGYVALEGKSIGLLLRHLISVTMHNGVCMYIYISMHMCIYIYVQAYVCVYIERGRDCKSEGFLIMATYTTASLRCGVQTRGAYGRAA